MLVEDGERWVEEEEKRGKKRRGRGREGEGEGEGEIAVREGGTETSRRQQATPTSPNLFV